MNFMVESHRSWIPSFLGIVLVCSLLAGTSLAQRKGPKDSKEMDFMIHGFAYQEPSKKLKLLTEWQKKYPDSEMTKEWDADQAKLKRYMTSERYLHPPSYW